MIGMLINFCSFIMLVYWESYYERCEIKKFIDWFKKIEVRCICRYSIRSGVEILLLL